MNKIGFIGVGVMGKSMIRNLMKDGYEVSIYTRTKSKADEVINEGAKWCDTVKECVRDKDIIITIVGFPKDVEEVYFGSEGIIQNVKENSVLIDMTTTDPNLSIKIYEEAKKRNVNSLDAPVSGGDIGAKNATLSIMVGGDKEVFDKYKSVLESMGSSVIYEGKPGNGQHTKMANQIAIAGAVSGVVEALSYAKATGLNIETMLESIKNGAAGSWQMSNMAPRMIKGDFEAGFYIKHFIKDMKIAENSAKSCNIDLEVLHTVLNMYENLEKNDMGDLGTQGLLKYYEK